MHRKYGKTDHLLDLLLSLCLTYACFLPSYYGRVPSNVHLLLRDCVSKKIKRIDSMCCIEHNRNSINNLIFSRLQNVTEPAQLTKLRNSILCVRYWSFVTRKTTVTHTCTFQFLSKAASMSPIIEIRFKLTNSYKFNINIVQCAKN
jgi:hypothetical protein